jgi:type IV secretion system protein VirD4
MNALELILRVGQWGQAHSQEVLGGLIAAPVLVGAASLALRYRRGVSTTHGSARWATPREVRRVGLVGPHGVVVGRLGRWLLCDNSETHVLLMGPTRSKKGVGVIILRLHRI